MIDGGLFDMAAFDPSAAERPDDDILVDLREWYEVHPKRPIDPQPELFSREALSERAGMEWLAQVDIQLVYPRSDDPAAQRVQLQALIDAMLAEAIRLPRSVCDTFPEGYNEPLLGVDAETTGLDLRVRYDRHGRLVTRTRIVGLSLATSAFKGYYLPVLHTGADGIPNWDYATIMWFIGRLHMLFACIYHNSYFDREVAALNGVTEFRAYPYFFDTLILSFFFDVNAPAHGLKVRSEKLLGRKMVEIQELFIGLGAGKAKDVVYFDTLPAVNATVYATADTLNTFGLFGFFMGQPEATNMFRHQSIPLQIDHKTVEVRRNMCRTGMPVNIGYFYHATRDAIYRTARIEQHIYELIGERVDLGSPKQLAALLYDKLKLQPLDGEVKGKAGFYSTGEEILDDLFKKYPDVEILKYIVLWRKVAAASTKTYVKCLANSFVDAFQPYARTQLSFSQTKIPTGRLSSSSSDGAERCTVKISPKTQKRSYKYKNGSWEIGLNAQGIPNPYLRKAKARRITALPPEAGIDLKALYPEWVQKALVQAVAES